MCGIHTPNHEDRGPSSAHVLEVQLLLDRACQTGRYLSEERQDEEKDKEQELPRTDKRQCPWKKLNIESALLSFERDWPGVLESVPDQQDRPGLGNKRRVRSARGCERDFHGERLQVGPLAPSAGKGWSGNACRWWRMDCWLSVGLARGWLSVGPCSPQTRTSEDGSVEVSGVWWKPIVTLPRPGLMTRLMSSSGPDGVEDGRQPPSVGKKCTAPLSSRGQSAKMHWRGYVPAARTSAARLPRLVLQCWAVAVGTHFNVCLASWTNRGGQISNSCPSPTSSVHA